MKNELNKLSKSAQIWFNIQYIRGIDENYVTNTILYKYVFYLKHFIESKEIPYSKFALKAYHYYKLGQFEKLENHYNNFLSNLNSISTIQVGVEVEVLKGQFTAPPKFHKVILKLIDKSIEHGPVMRALKRFFLLSIAVDKLTINNTNVIVGEKNMRILEKYNKDIKPIFHTVNIPNNTNEQSVLNEKPNVFDKRLDFEKVRIHFDVFRSRNERNFNKQWLTPAQLENFIQRAFKGDDKIDKLTFSCGKGEIMFIIRRFYQFYKNEDAKGFKAILTDRDKFIRLLTDNFTGWEYEVVKKYFRKLKGSRDWGAY